MNLRRLVHVQAVPLHDEVVRRRHPLPGAVLGRDECTAFVEVVDVALRVG